jgi:hypothetical protein
MNGANIWRQADYVTEHFNQHETLKKAINFHDPLEKFFNQFEKEEFNNHEEFNYEQTEQTEHFRSGRRKITSRRASTRQTIPATKTSDDDATYKNAYDDMVNQLRGSSVCPTSESVPGVNCSRINNNCYEPIAVDGKSKQCSSK